jgi:hypothetical protein
MISGFLRKSGLPMNSDEEKAAWEQWKKGFEERERIGRAWRAKIPPADFSLILDLSVTLRAPNLKGFLEAFFRQLQKPEFQHLKQYFDPEEIAQYQASPVSSPKDS